MIRREEGWNRPALDPLNQATHGAVAESLLQASIGERAVLISLCMN